MQVNKIFLIIEQGILLHQFFKDIMEQFFDMDRLEQGKHIQCMVQQIIINIEE